MFVPRNNREPESCATTRRDAKSVCRLELGVEDPINMIYGDGYEGRRACVLLLFTDSFSSSLVCALSIAQVPAESQPGTLEISPETLHRLQASLTRLWVVHLTKQGSHVSRKIAPGMQALPRQHAFWTTSRLSVQTLAVAKTCEPISYIWVRLFATREPNNHFKIQTAMSD